MLNATLNRKRPSRRVLLLAAAAFAAVAMPVAALRAVQGAPLPLTGLVYDATGAVLPEVKLTLEDAQRVKTEATTDASGQFQFPPVPSGKYTLEAALPGFKPLRQMVTLGTARDWKRIVMLQVGEVQETISVRASRIAGARPQASTASAAPAPVRVGGNIRPPRKMRHVSPVYPASMREAGLEGLVPMEAIIATDGKVQSVRVLTAEIHPDLAQAAVDAVKQWQFEPTLLNGAAVEVVMNVSVSFTLSD
jgi:TonB family protein